MHEPYQTRRSASIAFADCSLWSSAKIQSVSQDEPRDIGDGTMGGLAEDPSPEKIVRVIDLTDRASALRASTQGADAPTDPSLCACYVRPRRTAKLRQRRLRPRPSNLEEPSSIFRFIVLPRCSTCPRTALMAQRKKNFNIAFTISAIADGGRIFPSIADS